MQTAQLAASNEMLDLQLTEITSSIKEVEMQWGVAAPSDQC